MQEDIYYIEIESYIKKNEVNKKRRVLEENYDTLNNYWNIGKLLVEAQGGEARAKYGNEFNGQSLNIADYNEDELIINGQGRLFYQSLPFDEIIKTVRDLKRIDISKLDGIVEEFDNLLHKYQYITNMSDRRINRLCILLNKQIEKLRNLIRSN